MIQHFLPGVMGSAGDDLLKFTRGVPDSQNLAERWRDHYAALISSPIVMRNTRGSGRLFTASCYDTLRYGGISPDNILLNYRFDQEKHVSADILVLNPIARIMICLHTQTSLRERWRATDRDGLILEVYHQRFVEFQDGGTFYPYSGFIRNVTVMYKEQAGDTSFATAEDTKANQERFYCDMRLMTILDVERLQGLLGEMGCSSEMLRMTAAECHQSMAAFDKKRRYGQSHAPVPALESKPGTSGPMLI